MGLLTSAPEGASEDTSAEEAAADAEPAEAQTQEAASPKAEAVPLPAKPPSRREAARLDREALASEVASLKQAVTQRESEWQRQMAENQQQIARLIGHAEASRQQQQPAQQRPDVDAIMREAQKALDDKDIDTYHRKMREAWKTEQETAWESKAAQIRQQMPQQQAAPNPAVQMLIMEHKNVAMAGDRGLRAVMLKDAELGDVYGVPPGPERVRRAFELANNALTQHGGPQFSSGGRGALAGVPTGRAGGGGGGNRQPSVRPPDGWEKWATGAGMTKDEYLRTWADHHPETVDD